VKNVGVIVHAILAVGALILAYFAWTDTGVEAPPDEVTMFECTPEQLTSVLMHEERRDVRIEVSHQGDAPSIWVTVTRRPEHGDPSHEQFVGSHDAVDYLSKLAPFRAARSLGELSHEQLGELELAEHPGSLEIHCGSRTGTFDVGARSYGAGDRYLRSHGQGPVYLVAADRLQGLESAEFRLMQRDLHTFVQRDVVGVRLRADGRDKHLLQHNRLD